MLINLPSRILLNLIFQDLELFLKNRFECEYVAISPILEYNPEHKEFPHTIQITTAIRELSVHFCYECFTPDEISSFGEYIKNNTIHTGTSIKLLFRKDTIIGFHDSIRHAEGSIAWYEIAASIRRESNECIIHIIIPFEFFRLVIPSIRERIPSENIEIRIIHYLKNPAVLIPDIRTIIESLETRELAPLINRLQTGNMLSVYQLVLLITAFPDLSLKIKECLSQNIINDIIDMKKHIERYHINKRDIIGCVYSIQEAIFMLIQSGLSFRFSRYLSETEKTVKSILGMDLLLSKDFASWIEEMASNGLLYDTLCKCDEETIARSISPDRKKLLPVITKVVSGNKIESLELLFNEKSDYRLILESRLNMITAYRNLKMKRIRQSSESLDYLIARFRNSRDFNFVLLKVGWFVLSTGLKGVSKNNTMLALKDLPSGAKFLIEDILSGSVNPNIIHDEIQVNRAKSLCVKAIQNLYEEGIIILDE